MTEKETLRNYLDKMGVDKGSTAMFIVSIENVDMQVSRRYLETNAFRYILDTVIDHVSLINMDVGRIMPVQLSTKALITKFYLKNS